MVLKKEQLKLLEGKRCTSGRVVEHENSKSDASKEQRGVVEHNIGP